MTVEAEPTVSLQAPAARTSEPGVPPLCPVLPSAHWSAKRESFGVQPSRATRKLGSASSTAGSRLNAAAASLVSRPWPSSSTSSPDSPRSLALRRAPFAAARSSFPRSGMSARKRTSNSPSLCGAPCRTAAGGAAFVGSEAFPAGGSTVARAGVSASSEMVNV
jgi:hypothetical protein